MRASPRSCPSMPNPELVDMTRRFRIGLLFTPPPCSCTWAPTSAAHTRACWARLELDRVGPGDAGRSVGRLAVFAARLGLAADPPPQHVHADRHGYRRRLGLLGTVRPTLFPAPMRRPRAGAGCRRRLRQPAKGVTGLVEERGLLVGTAQPPGRSRHRRQSANGPARSRSRQRCHAHRRCHRWPAGRRHRRRSPLKASTPAAIAARKAAGITVAMLTGDRAATARAVARRLQIADVEAEPLPADKVTSVERRKQQGQIVAMAGDGINDAPALAAADVGIAMGTGTDVAMHSAGITLLQGDLAGIVRARALSTATMANIRQNLAFAFIYNIAGVPLAAGLLYPLLGLTLSPVFAAAAMALSSVSVIGNALRLKRLRL